MSAVGLKKYPAYKDSGIDWVGEIPEHWIAIRMKFSSKLINGYAFDSNSYVEDGIPIIRIGDINSDINLEDTKKVPFEMIESHSAFKVNRGDILLALTGATIGKSAVYTLQDDALLNQRVAIVRPENDTNDVFLKYLIQSNLFRKHIDYECFGGAQENIGKPEIGNFKLALPSGDEQKAIAEYLDKKTVLIDGLIEKKKRQIELLTEQRQAVINQAVTKGLDSAVEMKDSGVEWLGKIPKHWEMKRLKFVLNEKLKYGANESGDIDVPTFPRYIRITDFDDNGNLRDDTFRSLPDEQAQEYMLESGDILFARSGATVGKTFQFQNYDGRACFAGYLIKASPNSKQILSDFLYFYTKSNAYENWKDSIFIQATIQNIGADKYQNLPIAVPLIDEQEEIITYIHEEQKLINTSISKAEKQIELLQEYRTALISEAVTGKIDVREAV